jgi:hypothetical protein
VPLVFAVDLCAWAGAVSFRRHDNTESYSAVDGARYAMSSFSSVLVFLLSLSLSLSVDLSHSLCVHQAGLMAAAGHYALMNNVARLAEDHANAARLVQGLSRLGFGTTEDYETNMVFSNSERLPRSWSWAQIADRLRQLNQDQPVERTLLVDASGHDARLVVHMHTSLDGIELLLARIEKILSEDPPAP